MKTIGEGVPCDFLFVISGWDTRTKGQEFVQKEDTSEDLESQVEISDSSGSDAPQTPELGGLRGGVEERGWGVLEDERQMHHPQQEGAFTLVQMLLRSPSGAREVDCDEIKSSCSRSPSPVECQGPPAEGRPHPCGIQSLPCSLDLPSCTGLHVAESPFICSECGKTFQGDSDLTQHQTVHPGHKSFICNECGWLFSTHTVFLQHQLTHHGEKLHVSSECGKACQSPSLKKHQKSHVSEKPYECIECGKTFRRSSNLTQHQRIHSGEKPYVCPACGKAFRRSSNLVKHQRVHTGEKPFECTECGRAFSQISHVRKHQRVHTGERPYSCSECGKPFSRVSNLIKHHRVHTGA